MDEDHVPDYEDACPNVPGSVSAYGCPDSDRDGIRDSDDMCPFQSGTKSFNGCPDSDGDGIQDKDDRCPDVVGKHELNGCADSDGDGVADPDDQCQGMELSIAVDAKGCPLDRDGDGIPDHEDKCPQEAGVAARNGCPEVKQEVMELFKKALNGIRFETGKDIITKDSWPILDSVVVAMNANPEQTAHFRTHR